MLLAPQNDWLYIRTFTEQMANRADANFYMFNKTKCFLHANAKAFQIHN